MNNEKIVAKEAFEEIRKKLEVMKKKIVLCHGVYDLLHYGHIEHLQEAKAQGDILVVSVTSAPFVNKGPDRPHFNDKQRMAFLSSLEFVDYVMLSKAITVHDIVRYVQPDIYVKGQEYENASNDLTGNIDSEKMIVEQYGGKIYFTKGMIFSSTKLLNNYFGALPEDVLQTAQLLRTKYEMKKNGEKGVLSQIQGQIESFNNLKVLVVGDIIIDEYIFCKIKGLTSKDGILSTGYDYEERYAGGALAIARHLANFSDCVSLCTMMGQEKDLYSYIENAMEDISLYISQDENFITPVKRRFLKQNAQRQEYDKLFSINMLLEQQQFSKIDRSNFHQQLRRIVKDYDLVVVCDYGHGLIDDGAMRILEQESKYLAVNCQTNSTNYGMNLIKKYHRADIFVVDERELHLAYGQVTDENQKLLEDLYNDLNAKYGWVTVGAKGAIGHCKESQIAIPAVTLHIKDTIGAGDAFYALAALCAVRNVPLDLATLISNTAGAIKTNLLGNSKPVGKVDLLKYLSTILNV